MLKLNQIIAGPSKLSHGIAATRTHVYYCSDSLLLRFAPGEFFVSGIFSEHTSKLTTVCAYNDTLLVTDVHGKCSMVDANTLQSFKTFNVESEVISSTIGSYKNEVFYAVATIDSKLHIFLGDQVIVKNTERPIESLAYLNSFFAVASTDKKVYIYNLDKSVDEPIYTVRRHEDFVSNMAMGEINGFTILACASHDRSISVFNLFDNPRITSILECHHPEKASGCCFYGDQLITVGYDNRICWNVSNPRMRFTNEFSVFVEESRHHVGLLSVVATEKHVVALSSLGYLVCYDAVTREAIACPGGHISDVTSIDVLDNNLIVSASKDQTVRLWANKNGHFFELSRVLSHGSELYCVKACPETTQLITGGDESTCRFLQPAKHTVDSLRMLGYKAPTVGQLPKGVGMLLLHQETEGFYDELPSERFIDNSKRSRLAENSLLPFDFIEGSDEPILNQQLARNTLWSTLSAERVLVDIRKLVRIGAHVIGVGYAARGDESVLNIYKVFDDTLVGVKIVKGLFSTQVNDIKVCGDKVVTIDRRHLVITDALGELVCKIKTPGIAHLCEVVKDQIYIIVEDTIYRLEGQEFVQIKSYDELITAVASIGDELCIAIANRIVYRGQETYIPCKNSITSIRADDKNIYVSAGRFICALTE